MKNKEDLRTENEATEVKTTAVETETKLKNPKKNELPGNEPENKQTGLHHISRNRNSAERFNLDEDESTRNNSKMIVAHEQEFEGKEEGANKDGMVIREQAQGIEDNTQSIENCQAPLVTGVLENGILSYFHSIMTYGIIFWGNSRHSNVIFRLHKRVIRIITGIRNRDSCREHFRTLKILPLQSQYILSLLLL